MPFVQIFLSAETDAPSRKEISLSVHESLKAIYGIPENDYFQVIHEVKPGDLIFPPSYLGIPHGDRVVYIQILARQGRTPEMKQALYRSIAEKVAARTTLPKEDVIIVLTENTSENWSFGQGEAQMLDPNWQKRTELDKT